MPNFKKEDFIKVGDKYLLKNSNNKIHSKKEMELLVNGNDDIEKTTQPERGHKKRKSA